MQTNEEVVYLYLDDIIPNRFQPREIFDERPLKELAVSIKEHGVIQPIIVRKVNDKYEIIAGERRYKASALAGLTKIPAIIRDLDDKESSKVALLENLQRKNLNAIEEAKTYQKILEIDEMTQEDLAKTMGKSQSAVANKLRLLSLPDEIQDALMKDRISERHARALINIEDSEKQKEMLKRIIDEKMTVRQLESEIKKINGKEEINMEIESNPEIMIPTLKEVPKAENFIPENPILPNFNGENTDLNTPILSNIESISQKEEPNTEILSENTSTVEEEKPKFINFGEIDDEDDSEEDSINSNFNFSNPKENATINIEELKANATDIFTPNSTNSNGADLDSLLQLGEIKSPQKEEKEEEQTGFKFFSPAQEALKESEEKEQPKHEDYFKAPELISVDLPSEIQTNNINSVNLNTLDSSPNITSQNIIRNSNQGMNQAVDKIRDALKEIEKLGFKVEKDEMDLENSYQVIIKIQK